MNNSIYSYPYFSALICVDPRAIIYFFFCNYNLPTQNIIEPKSKHNIRFKYIKKDNPAGLSFLV